MNLNNKFMKIVEKENTLPNKFINKLKKLKFKTKMN